MRRQLRNRSQRLHQRLHLLQLHLPYHESDHVRNIAYNALCDGTCLEDIELRRNDEVFLELIDELSPGVVKINGPFLYVVMPMRLS